MLTFNELTRWTGLTLFELNMHLIALLISTILLVFKCQFTFAISFMQVFSPLFVASALNLYFLIIVFIRAVVEDRQFKRAVINNACHFKRTALVAFFEVTLVAWALKIIWMNGAAYFYFNNPQNGNRRRREAAIIKMLVFLCYKVEGELEHEKVAVESAYWVVLMPIWILLIMLSVHACRLL